MDKTMARWEPEAVHIQRLMRAQTATDRRRCERQTAAGKLAAPLRGMFADAEEWARVSPSERARRVIATLADAHEHWVFCLFSAAVVYGLEVGRDDLRSVHRLSDYSTRCNKDGSIVAHHTNQRDFFLVDGIKVTPPLRTAIDCMCMLGFGRALAIADSALRVLGLDKGELCEELERRGECPGWRIARDAIAYADARSMNGGESMARAVMIEQGFMIPELQVKQRDPLNPASHYFVDFYWNLGKTGSVAGELDGRDKYVLPEMTGGRDVVDVMRDERLRESRISVDGLRVMRFSFADVMNEGRFTKMLERYGIPRGPARPIGK